MFAEATARKRIRTTDTALHRGTPPDYDSSNRRYPIFVILHGNGSNETSRGQLADDFGREGVIYVAVRAPYPSGGSAGRGQPGYTAWPPETFDPISEVRI